MKDNWTTILGILAGAVNYVATVGTQMPGNKQEWMTLLFSALLAGLGYKAKDVTSATNKLEDESKSTANS